MYFQEEKKEDVNFTPVYFLSELLICKGMLGFGTMSEKNNQKMCHRKFKTNELYKTIEIKGGKENLEGAKVFKKLFA